LLFGNSISQKFGADAARRRASGQGVKEAQTPERSFFAGLTTPTSEKPVAQSTYVEFAGINKGVNKNIEKATERGASIARRSFLMSYNTNKRKANGSKTLRQLRGYQQPYQQAVNKGVNTRSTNEMRTAEVAEEHRDGLGRKLYSVFLCVRCGWLDRSMIRRRGAEP
jgi:hypothetical protein